MLRLALPTDQLIGTSSRVILTRSYATKPFKSAKKTGSKGTGGGNRGQIEQADSRIDLIRKTLYESSPTDQERLQALSKVVPSIEAHETITRAWALHRRHQREAHEGSLRAKYASMQAALQLLEQTSPQLYAKATQGDKFQNVDQEGYGNERLTGIVPRELRAPMELAGKVRWDSGWTRSIPAADAKLKPATE
ncbi:BZ3500_MvSof-1268-A1-R1_Chr7-1g09180 [Microbotryum saponariae]|uniref:Large ribosomal subunit protein mL40 n=1 Tax=Microbotryum saponariae TaxID=289078 RepID=A0A2X0LDM3_9BASI|nr:BZ3501_MvSof-1269-A2-R1_Chr7-1g08885 [Microbotryum saponariae]SDA02948.1 BZ3500_MvSof-1268-A1-R1_Chr7-1g09180 [Microbotryum saponariae]